MAAYSDEERDTVRSAAFGAVALVSKADPGFFAMFKESMAGSKAFTTASPELQELLKSGGMPNLPKGSSDEIDKSILSSVERAVAILQQRGPMRSKVSGRSSSTPATRSPRRRRVSHPPRPRRSAR